MRSREWRDIAGNSWNDYALLIALLLWLAAYACSCSEAPMPDWRECQDLNDTRYIMCPENPAACRDAWKALRASGCPITG